MSGPTWLADVFAAIVIGVALFSAARLIVSRGWLEHGRLVQGRLGYGRLGHGRYGRGELDADVVHVLMGIAMAGMFVPGLATLPAPAWEAVFAVGTAWFAWRTVRGRRLSLVGGSATAEEPGSSGGAGSFCGPGSSGGVGSSGGLGSAGQAGAVGKPGLGRRLAASGGYCRYPLPHLIDTVAMLYMLWVVSDIRSATASASGGMGGGAAGMGGAGVARLPFLGLILVLCICGYIVWLGDRLPAAAAVTTGGDSHDRDRSAAVTGGQSVTIMEAAPATPAGGACGARVAVAGVTGVNAAQARVAGAGVAQARVAGTCAAQARLAGASAAGSEVAGASAAGSEVAGASAAGSEAAGRSLLAPRTAMCCKIAMGVAMGVMLIDLV
jgi:hypothetical protein